MIRENLKSIRHKKREKKIAEKFIDIRFLPQIKDNGNEKK